MRQFLDQYPLGQYPLKEFTSPGEPAVRFVARLISALDDWRERERLRRELSRLAADGELDGLLEEIGVSRGQLRLPLAMQTSDDGGIAQQECGVLGELDAMRGQIF
jgi:uncharacterized protein YjiS (DUF1127 family)